MRRGVRDRKGGRAWESIVGYSLEQLITHLERRFSPGMSWQEMDRWHIDHVRPLSSFDIKAIGDAEFLRAWDLQNLRPMWAADNLKKGARYAAPAQTKSPEIDQRESAA